MFKVILLPGRAHTTETWISTIREDVQEDFDLRICPYTSSPSSSESSKSVSVRSIEG